LGGPVAAEIPLDAAADGPAGVRLAARPGQRNDGPARSDRGQHGVGLNFAEGKAAGHVEEPGWRGEHAEAPADRAEPFELLVDREPDAERTDRQERRTRKARAGEKPRRRAQEGRAALLAAP